jgi:hypothetical protein
MLKHDISVVIILFFEYCFWIKCSLEHLKIFFYPGPGFQLRPEE